MTNQHLKIGMKIKICNDPSKSISCYSGSITKRKLAGTIQRICEVGHNFIRIRYNGENWTFVHEDYSIVHSKPIKIKKELFNTENLCL